MRAVVLQSDRTLIVKQVPSPQLLPGSAIVEVLAVQVANFATDVISGALKYPHGQPPVVLGPSAVGKVLHVAEDVRDVHPGDIVYCDPMVGSHSNNGRHDCILQGWSAHEPDSLETQEKYRNGAFAERFVTPAACLTIIRKPELHSMAQWATLIYFSVAHGAILRGEIKAGQVLAMGRNTAALSRLVVLDPARVVPVVLRPDEALLTVLKVALKQHEVDVALDIVGHADTPNIALACLNCLKRNGILVLDGSMDCPLPIPYGWVVRKNLEIRGAYMSSRSTPQTLVQLVESKVLNFDQLEVKGFPLDTITECVKQARMASALQFMVLEPNK
ncbi:MAG: hypothetical protein FRX49_13617 [Trebouxia sp. A1-2]|nr:MAG: hypothetical protein FRX49_13617 [Trebouxia sp. A1-2]